MGKKKKIKKQLNTFVKSNKLLIAAFGGAAAGLTLAGIFGTEKGKEILNTVENAVIDTADKITNGITRSPKREAVNQA